MAAFTTLALIGLAGAVAGRASKRTGAQPAPVAAPGPTNANTLAAPPAPVDTTQAASAAVVAGQQAAAKQKKKAVGRIGAGLAPSIVRPPRAVGQMPTLKTLVGGGY